MKKFLTVLTLAALLPAVFAEPAPAPAIPKVPAPVGPSSPPPPVPGLTPPKLSLSTVPVLWTGDDLVVLVAIIRKVEERLAGQDARIVSLEADLATERSKRAELEVTVCSLRAELEGKR